MFELNYSHWLNSLNKNTLFKNKLSSQSGKYVTYLLITLLACVSRNQIIVHLVLLKTFLLFAITQIYTTQRYIIIVGISTDERSRKHSKG